MQSVNWYLSRLGRMSAGEIGWRAGKVLRRNLDRWRVPIAAPRVPAADVAGAQFVKIPRGLDSAPYEAASERIMSGNYTIFNLGSSQLGSPPDWNRDPATGKFAPLLRSAALDYRDENLVGDIKYLWEPNRHLHLGTLAQTYALTARFEYARAVERHIDSWIAQCPVGRGANWTSALELAIRLINWSIAWQLLGGEASPLFSGKRGHFFRIRWLQSVHHHIREIATNLSHYSSANNHLIGEAAGVWIAAVTWPYWPDVRQWGDRCRGILEKELFKQNAPDGGNREQALSYQQFVLDFYLLSGLAARSVGRDFAPEYWQRLEKMTEFLASLMDVAGNAPMLGDADDGYVTRLTPQQDFDPYRSLIASAAIVYERPDFAVKAGAVDAKTHWLLGDCGNERFTKLRQNTVGKFTPTRAFPDSGYYLLGDRLETPDEIRMLIDAGPLGYLSLAAHGHADALAVVLNVGGHEVLIDPGTYAYHTKPEWRRYFRGTSAHNTVTVDNQDQSLQRGNFMWSRHANARCAEFSSGGGRQRFVGEHDGYIALADPVVHRREVIYDETTRSFQIIDTLECKQTHKAVRRWHFSENVTPVAFENCIEASVGEFTVILTADEPVTVHTFKAGSALEGGWISRKFGRKLPCTTVAWDATIAGTTVLKTRILIRKE